MPPSVDYVIYRSDCSHRYFERTFLLVPSFPPYHLTPVALSLMLHVPALHSLVVRRRKIASTVLPTGLSQCKLNEGLLTKAIKQQEKLHDVDAARGMLSALRHESIERVWKVSTEKHKNPNCRMNRHWERETERELVCDRGL